MSKSSSLSNNERKTVSQNANVLSNVLVSIGNTPMLELASHGPIPIHSKVEFLNPGRITKNHVVKYIL